MNYLELVEFYMDEYNMDEDSACREASAVLYPDTYDANDYDGEDYCYDNYTGESY